MTDSENEPIQRKRSRATTSTLNRKKRKITQTQKQKDSNQAQAAADIKKAETVLKNMKRSFKKAGKSKASTQDEDIEECESEEDDPDPISSFRPDIRHIDTNISHTPSRRLLPASTNRLALAPVTNTSATHDHDDDELEDSDAGFGDPTTGTTSTPSLPHYDYPPSPTSPSSSAPNISSRLSPSQTAANTQSPHPRVAEWKNGIAPTDRRRPCASDYCDEAKRIILKACGRYEVFIVTEEVFPDHDVQLTKAREFFIEACDTFGVEYRVTDRILAIIKARGSRIRGAIRTSVQMRGDLKFGFIRRPGSKSGIAKNKKRAEGLLENDSFCWGRPFDKDGGFAENPLTFDIFNNVFFARFQRSLGIAYADHFNPFPLPTLALIITSMAFHIQQYEKDGTMTAQQQFSETSAKVLYDAYLKKVEEWADLEPDVTLKLREKWYRCAVRFGGASVTVVKGMSNEERQRAQMALAGRTIDVDADNSNVSDSSQEL